MNRTTQSKWIAALCVVAMAGCASDPMSSDTSSSSGSMSSTSGSSGTSTSGSSSGSSSGYAQGSGSSSSMSPSSTTSPGSTTSSGSSSMSPSSSTATTGTSGSSTGSSTGSTTAPTTSGSSAQTMYGVVAAIDQMQRQDVGVGALGAAAAGGSTGLPTDRVYRVTVRMDDGSSQMVVVDTAPSYRIGDRVRYDGSSGTLVSY